LHGQNRGSRAEIARRSAAGRGWQELSDDESLLLFRGLHILGTARDREACQPLLRLLRRPFDEVDALLGDAVIESLAKIVTGAFDDDSDALFAVIIDSIDGFIREALFGAATFLTWERRIDRDRFREFLVRFYEKRPAEDGDQAWAGWLQAISLLGLHDLVPLVDGAFREDRIPEEWIDRPQFDEGLAEAERAPDDIDRFRQSNLGYIEDVLVSLAWVRGSEDVFDENDEEAPWTDLAYPNEPVRNPWRHVGRNDPCPCGSGKKAKKCCQWRAAGVTPAARNLNAPSSRRGLRAARWRFRHPTSSRRPRGASRWHPRVPSGQRD
jgi:hypothetical protein